MSCSVKWLVLVDVSVSGLRHDAHRPGAVHMLGRSVFSVSM